MYEYRPLFLPQAPRPAFWKLWPFTRKDISNMPINETVNIIANLSTNLVYEGLLIEINSIQPIHDPKSNVKSFTVLIGSSTGGKTNIETAAPVKTITTWNNLLTDIFEF